MEKYIVVKVNSDENNVGKFEKLETLKRQRKATEDMTRETIESLQMENLMKMVIYINDLYESYKKIGGLAECHRFMDSVSSDSSIADFVVEARDYHYSGINTLISFGSSIGQERYCCSVLDDEIKLPKYSTSLGKAINEMMQKWPTIKKHLETQVKYYRHLEEQSEIEKINNIKSMLENATNFEL